jgi:epoxyqueuosine reductase
VQNDPVELGREVVRACLGLGFAAAGIARAEESGWGDQLREWLAAGKHGTMEWMEEYLAERLDVRRLLPGAKSVMVVADAYAAAGTNEIEPECGSAEGVIARYARGEDYHAVLKRRLKRLADTLRKLPEAKEAAFRSFVDTGPAMEREHAARAGLGWIGKHTLLIHPTRGSWFVLGGIATTLDIAGSPDAQRVVDHCGTCTRCIDGCPTQAITPYSVDARRCVSYLTIEHEGIIDPSLHAGIGQRLIGCDVCQEVCPFNQPGGQEHGQAHEVSEHTTGVNEAYQPARSVGASLPLLEVLGWDEEARSRALTLSAAKRASLAMFKRNALIAAGNAILQGRDGSALLRRVREIAADDTENEVVRETAALVLARVELRG